MPMAGDRPAPEVVHSGWRSWMKRIIGADGGSQRPRVRKSRFRFQPHCDPRRLARSAGSAIAAGPPGAARARQCRHRECPIMVSGQIACENRSTIEGADLGRGLRGLVRASPPQCLCKCRRIYHGSVEPYRAPGIVRVRHGALSRPCGQGDAMNSRTDNPSDDCDSRRAPRAGPHRAIPIPSRRTEGR